VLQRVDPGRHGGRAARRVLRVDSDAAADRVHLLDHGTQHISRHRLVVDVPVGDDLGPAGPPRLRRRHPRKRRAVRAAAPAVEELPVLAIHRPA
jgi:hypothetical protein